MENPYAPPTATATETVNERVGQAPQYTPNQVAGATFLGTVFAGALLMAANDRAVGQPARGNQTIAVGFVVTLITLGVALILPANFPSFIIPLGTTLGARAVAQARLSEHMRHNPEPPRRSSWHAFGIGMAVMLVCLGLFMGLALVWPDMFAE